MAINTPSSAYKAGQALRALPNALYGGTDSMRKQGTKYLPLEPREVPVMYAARLKRSFLKNCFKAAVTGTRGKIFSKPVTVEGYDDTFLADVDRNGTSITTFASDLFTASAKAGVAFILIDAARQGEEVKTTAQFRALNIRPFFTVVTADQLIGYKVESVNNVPTLVDARITEQHIEEDDDFNETVYEQIRRLQLTAGGVVITIHRRRHGTSDWFTLTPVTLPKLKTIPLVPYYTNQTGYFEGETFFEDLCWTNLQHWQSSSDQNNILHIVRVPRFKIIGFNTTELKDIEDHGVASTIHTSKRPEEVDVGWVEAEGKSIALGAESIEGLEQDMDALSLEPSVSKASGDVTATRTKTEAVKANSVIQSWARNMAGALNDALRFANVFSGTGSEPDAKVNDDFKLIEESDKKAEAILKWRAGRLITHRTALVAGKRLPDFLPPDLDVDKEIKLVAEEMPAIAGNLFSADDEGEVLEDVNG